MIYLKEFNIVSWPASGVNGIHGDHLFSTYAKFSEKLIFLTPRYAHVRTEWTIPASMISVTCHRKYQEFMCTFMIETGLKPTTT